MRALYSQQPLRASRARGQVAAFKARGRFIFHTYSTVPTSLITESKKRFNVVKVEEFRCKE